MGLRDTIQALVNSAITEQIGDLKSTATFRSVARGTYDATLGKAPKTVTEHEVQCVITNVRQDGMFIDYADHLRNMAGVEQADRKLLIPALQLTGVNVDTLEAEARVDGELYNILSSRLDPSGSLYIFLLKSKGGGTVGVA